MTNGIISNLLSKNMPYVEEAKEHIKKAYKEDNRPWVVGYSGGKDSTVVVQLVFEALSEMDKEELHKKVYVISSDTLVETPLIINSINQTLRRIQDEALKRDLPIETHKVKPVIKQSFWVNIIGKGYPSPNQQFRWCTDRLKIDPANQFIMEKVSSFGEVIMVLGVREDESATRGNVIRSHTVEGKTFMRHSTLSNAYVYAPIRSYTLDDVWDYLLNHPSPWGDDNHELHRLYQDSNSGECPLVVDKSVKESAGSCGNSRFGCWVCTVVNEDKALSGFIQSGHDWMRPLLDFRNWLSSIRDDREKRMKYRMNGQIYYKEVRIEDIDGVPHVMIPKKSGRPKQQIPLDQYTVMEKEKLKSYIESNNVDLSAPEDQRILVTYEEEMLDGEKVLKYAQLGLGPYTMEARKEILVRLLKVQKDLKHPEDPYYELISVDELKAIRKIWFKNGEWEDPIPTIYEEIMDQSIDWEIDDRPLFDNEQISDLELLADQFKVDIKVLKKLISIEKEFSGYKVRRGLINEIGKALKQDYLHL
ncbi:MULTISPECIES: DNA phosphorothioation system sulfurtransferase DndC [Cytobacillus]|uniref:DNA phosphorothioation system sulfurtransferase DndC n=1 Tax=Cytobacillus TaxID=2675230 RepID=UPI00203F38F6|nr:DNA phosphorothioation system sulfurtransferase DndC [Cytobacillus oceanisediminis]MCM3243171.1 DNA phosphorothioation system sulfurtransferase DndC [Cytobacillus oceanisediminis]MDK7665414.1 DNA phosphorothioation system sulfurtransferase DndC [Cytobacillus oceanisediminis]